MKNKKLSEMSLEELWQLFPIILKEHNPEYTSWYKEKECQIKDTIGNSIFSINHIGSTAVKGLIAKPIVDILVEVKDNDLFAIAEKLVKIGWIVMSSEKSRISLNYGYTEKGFADKVYHLHLRRVGDCEEILFRDYLIKNKHIATEYEKLKIALAEKYKNNRDAYTEAKSDFIKKYTEPS